MSRECALCAPPWPAFCRRLLPWLSCTWTVLLWTLVKKSRKKKIAVTNMDFESQHWPCTWSPCVLRRSIRVRHGKSLEGWHEQARRPDRLGALAAPSLWAAPGRICLRPRARKPTAPPTVPASAIQPGRAAVSHSRSRTSLSLARAVHASQFCTQPAKASVGYLT